MREFVHGGLEYQATLNKVQELEEQLQQLLKEKVWKTCCVRSDF